MKRYHQLRQNNARTLEKVREMRNRPDHGVRLRDRDYVEGVTLDRDNADLVGEVISTFVNASKKRDTRPVSKVIVPETAKGATDMPKAVGKAILTVATERYIEVQTNVSAVSWEATNLAKERMLDDAKSSVVGFALLVVSQHPELPKEVAAIQERRIADIESTAGNLVVPSLILEVPYPQAPSQADPAQGEVVGLHIVGDLPAQASSQS